MNCKNCNKELYGTPRESLQGEYIEYNHVGSIGGDYYHCHKKDVLPGIPPPRCHICKVLKPPHKPHCSACGMPQYWPRPKPDGC